MTKLDLDGPLIPGKSDECVVHDWSIHPLINDPAIKARMRKALRLRASEALAEADMGVRERKARNEAKIEEREQALGAIFGWAPGDGFPLGQLSPPDYDCAYKTGWMIRDHLAGFDHPTSFYDDGRQVAIVSQPYLPAFECAKKEGRVSEVERVRGVRIIELSPTLSWYSLKPRVLPTAVVLWLRG